MQQVLLLTGDLGLPTYATLISVGLILATFVVRREAERDGLNRRAVFDVALFLIPAAFFWGRVFGVFADPAYWLEDPVQRLLWDGGFTFYGSFLGGAGTLFLVARWRGLNPWRVVDGLSLGMIFGVPFGRLGCLGSGCCHGRPADWPLGIEVPWSVRYYAPGSIPDPLLAVPLHPTPLYDGVLALGLFVLLSRMRRRSLPAGATFCGVLMGYALLRSTTELFRGDLARGFFFDGWLSTAQVTSIPVFLTGLIGWVVAHRREA